MLNWSVDRKKDEIGIFGHAINAFAGSLCQQTGGQFCHEIGCNICPKRPLITSSLKNPRLIFSLMKTTDSFYWLLKPNSRYISLNFV